MSTHPRILATVDGIPVSGAFFERLVSLSIVDREGIRSDTLEMRFDDGPPHFLSPRRGAVVAVTIADGSGGGLAGSYVIDRIERACLPYEITVRGHSADLRAELKERRTRHWDDVSVKALVEQKAADHGLSVRVSVAVAGHVYDWIGQQDETDLAFLERVAARHGALFTIKNGTLLWLALGRGETADAETIPATVVTPASVLVGNPRITESDVDRFATVRAYWQDTRGAARREVVVPADPEATGEHVLRDPFGTEAEARAAADAEARRMMQGVIETTCTVVGHAGLLAGQPVIYRGFVPGVDGREFIVDTVRHSYSKSGGLQTAFSGKVKAP
jgi:phage protein D